MTNPVARLAALLVKADIECPMQADPFEWANALAEWLLARGVQYAPREPRPLAMQQRLEREPPPEDDEIAAWRTLELTRLRRLTGQPIIWLKWHVMEELEREEWRGRFGARGRLEGPPQKISEPTIEELISLGECAVGGYFDFPAAKAWFAKWLAGGAAVLPPGEGK